jgi:hypothetical protein
MATGCINHSVCAWLEGCQWLEFGSYQSPRFIPRLTLAEQETADGTWQFPFKGFVGRRSSSSTCLQSSADFGCGGSLCVSLDWETPRGGGYTGRDGGRQRSSIMSCNYAAASLRQSASLRANSTGSIIVICQIDCVKIGAPPGRLPLGWRRPLEPCGRRPCRRLRRDKETAVRKRTWSGDPPEYTSRDARPEGLP